MEWTQQELSLHSEESHKAFPLWNLATWSQLESKLDQMGDEHTRLQAVRMLCTFPLQNCTFLGFTIAIRI